MRNKRLTPRGGPPDAAALLATAQRLICATPLWRTGPRGMRFFGEQVVFGGEDYKNGTVLDLVIEYLVHSVDTPSYGADDPRSMRNSIYAMFGSGLSGAMQGMPVGVIPYGSPLYYCVDHGVEHDILQTMIETASLSYLMQVPPPRLAHARARARAHTQRRRRAQWTTNVGQSAYEEYCSITGLDALHAGSLSGPLSMYVPNVLLPDSAYGVVQTCGGDGVRQCSSRDMGAMVMPMEWAPAVPLAACATEPYVKCVEQVRTTCCTEMQITNLALLLVGFVMPGGFALGIVEMYAETAIMATVSSEVPGCNCEPLHTCQYVMAYRQSPACVWEQFVLVMETLAPVPIPGLPCGIQDATAQTVNRLETCGCSSADVRGGIVAGGAYCEMALPMGPFGVLDSKTGDPYCAVGTGMGPDGAMCRCVRRRRRVCGGGAHTVVPAAPCAAAVSRPRLPASGGSRWGTRGCRASRAPRRRGTTLTSA